MHKFIVIVTAMIVAVTSFSTPSLALGPHPSLSGNGSSIAEGDVMTVDHYYGHYRKKHYREKKRRHQECWWKKVRRYDEYGDLYYERVRICR